MKINNLSQLKKALIKGSKFKVLEHNKTECIGQIRTINIVQTNGFYSIIENEPTSNITLANAGKGYWVQYAKANCYNFDNGLVCWYFNENQKELLMKIEVLD